MANVKTVSPLLCLEIGDLQKMPIGQGKYFPYVMNRSQRQWAYLTGNFIKYSNKFKEDIYLFCSIIFKVKML